MLAGMSLGMQILVLVVYTLALMRLVRLINADKITDKLRTFPATRITQHRRAMNEARLSGHATIADMHARRLLRWDTVLYYVGCPWCVGMGLALVTAWVPLYVPENPVARYLAVALAVSHVVGVMARFADTEDVVVEDDDDDDQ
jgi:hypothetical protein